MLLWVGGGNFLYLFAVYNYNTLAIFRAVRGVTNRVKFSVFFVPYKTHEMMMLLEQQSFHFIGEYHLEMIPLDSDLISLQIPQSFRVSFAEIKTPH